MSSKTSDDIIEILSVTDTRTWEEGPDDKWYPVPGSGTENECARCGKLHVIHARVKLGDGSVAIVGTTCADRGSLLFKQLRSAASKATRRAKLESQLAAAIAAAERYDEAEAAVDKLPRPPIEERKDVMLGTLEGPNSKYELRMGDAAIWASFREGVTDERRRCLERSWARKRRADLGVTGCCDIVHCRVRELQRRLQRLA